MDRKRKHNDDSSDEEDGQISTGRPRGQGERKREPFSKRLAVGLPIPVISAGGSGSKRKTPPREYSSDEENGQVSQQRRKKKSARRSPSPTGHGRTAAADHLICHSRAKREPIEAKSLRQSPEKSNVRNEIASNERSHARESSGRRRVRGPSESPERKSPSNSSGYGSSHGDRMNGHGHSPVSVTHWRGKEATRARDIRRAIQHRVTREVLEKFSGEMAAEDQREEEEAVERCDAEIRAVCERYAGEKALRVARRARTDPLLDGLMRFVMYTCRRA